MKLYRAPKVGGYWMLTDQKAPSDYLAEWKPGKYIVVDGTINKNGERHTLFAIELDEDDVLALSNSLVTYYRSQISRLNSEWSRAETENKRYEEVMEKIQDVLRFHAEKAPDTDELAEFIDDIADYYRYSHIEGPPSRSWLKWEDI